MRFIDKNKFHEEEHSINVKFLQQCYSCDLKEFIPSLDDAKLSFDDFKKKDFRGKNDEPSGWENLLLREQDQRCCYCMRKLHQGNGHINYEHVIPRCLFGNEGQQEYSYYSQKSQILRDFVMMSDEFVKKKFSSLDEIAGEEKMPHITSLANLLAACNGKRNSDKSVGCCCNNSRGNDRILPIMLMPESKDIVKYDANGILIITTKDKTLTKIISELNDETLQEVRSVWYHLSKSEVDLLVAENYSLNERIAWFEDSYNTNIASLPNNIKKYVGLLDRNHFYWELLKDYDWFYGYYREQ